jgi:hypothetical protein
MSFADAKKKIDAAIEKAVKELRKPSSMRKIGEQAADMIRTRTLLGYGVKDAGAPRARLKPLSASYKARRRDDDDLSGNTTPGRSNLTRTGQMLDSVRVTDVKEGSVTVGPKGKRADRKMNEQVAEYVTDAGRPFNNISNVEKKRIEDQTKIELEKELATNLTKLK